MSSKNILIVAGEPNSVFLEIFFKSLKSLKVKSPLILISSFKLIKAQMKKLDNAWLGVLLAGGKKHVFFSSRASANPGPPRRTRGPVSDRQVPDR